MASSWLRRVLELNELQVGILFQRQCLKHFIRVGLLIAGLQIAACGARLRRPEDLLHFCNFNSLYLGTGTTVVLLLVNQLRYVYISRTPVNVVDQVISASIAQS